MNIEPSGPRETAGAAGSAPALLDRVASKILPRLDELGGPGTFVTPVLLVTLFSLLAVAGIDPVLELAIRDDPARATAVRSWVRLFGWLGPVLAMLKGLALGGAAWAVLELVGATPRFRAVVSAILYGEVVLSLQGLWIALVLNVRAGWGVVAPGGLHVPSGLDVFGLPSDPVTAALVQGFSVFHVAWVVLLCLAFAQSASTTRARGAVAAGAVWFLVTGIGVLRASFA